MLTTWSDYAWLVVPLGAALVGWWLSKLHTGLGLRRELSQGWVIRRGVHYRLFSDAELDSQHALALHHLSHAGALERRREVTQWLGMGDLDDYLERWWVRHEAKSAPVPHVETRHPEAR